MVTMLIPKMWGKFCQFWHNKIHFIQLHYLYFMLLILISSGLYYTEKGTNWAYIDALFSATTGSTNTGLNVIDMSKMSSWQLGIMMIDTFLGSHVFVSFIVLMVRKHYFSKRFEDILLFNKAQRMREEHRRKQLAQLDPESGNQTPSSRLRRRFSFLSVQSQPEITEKHQELPQHPTQTHTTSPGTGSDENLPGFVTIQETEHLDDDTRGGYFQGQDSLPADTLSKTGWRSSMSEDDLEGRLREIIAYNELTDTSKFSSTTTGNHGIAFAHNIERQREIARQRLETDRKYDELRKRFTVDTESQTDSEKHRVDNIMRQPIDKSELTREERYRIGGAEYRALDLLSYIVPCYALGLIIVMAFGLRIYIATSAYAREVLATSNSNGPVNEWYFCFFYSISAFTNLGLCHLDASVIPFQSAPAPLLIAMFLILAGNTAYALLLRFVIWCLLKLTPRSRQMRREALQFLLDHPRRCYTTLFPATQTWWLLITLLAITLTETICFILLNYWLPVLSGLTWGARVLDGFFQSVATRNAGFTVVSLDDLNPAMQLVFIVAMYISVYPVAISMRNSNVYQERALGIFRSEEPMQFTEKELSGPAPFIKLKRQTTINSVMTASIMKLRRPDFFVVTQLQRQLTSDICWVIVGIFCICALESQAIMSTSPITTSSVIYECVSAFGNVGASLGYPNTASSQSAQYRVVSKLVVVILMVRGRHRGLPAAIDRAVLLPSEQLEEADAHDHLLRRRSTSTTQNNSSSDPLPTPGVMFYTRSRTL